MNLWPSGLRSNRNLKKLVFEGRKTSGPEEKNPRSENQQQIQPTGDTGCGNRTQATLVGGECSYHCAIPATQIMSRDRNLLYCVRAKATYRLQATSYKLQPMAELQAIIYKIRQLVKQLLWAGISLIDA